MENIIFGILILLAALVWAGITVWKVKNGIAPIDTGTKIMLNFPEDAKRLEMLPPDKSFDEKTIEGQKAILWWSVFKAGLDESGVGSWSVEYANEAVDKVYGKQ